MPQMSNETLHQQHQQLYAVDTLTSVFLVLDTIFCYEASVSPIEVSCNQSSRTSSDGSLVRTRCRLGSDGAFFKGPQSKLSHGGCHGCASGRVSTSDPLQHAERRVAAFDYDLYWDLLHRTDCSHPTLVALVPANKRSEAGTWRTWR